MVIAIRIYIIDLIQEQAIMLASLIMIKLTVYKQNEKNIPFLASLSFNYQRTVSLQFCSKISAFKIHITNSINKMYIYYQYQIKNLLSGLKMKHLLCVGTGYIITNSGTNTFFENDLNVTVYQYDSFFDH